MPFTFSHPAIILPFLKSKKVSVTALVVGSMSPDFEYFFRMKMHSDISHSFPGIFLVDYPLGFIIIFAFHCMIKQPLIDNLPLFVRRRTNQLYNLDWITYFRTHVVIVFLSFFIGSCSHIFWDSFTHSNGYFVDKLAFLSQEFLSLPLYKFAQHISSLLGFCILLNYFIKQPEEVVTTREFSIAYWTIVFIFTTFLLLLRFLAGLQLQEIGSVVVSVLFAIITALAFTGLLFKKKALDRE